MIRYKSKKAISLLSGGIDSAVTTAYAKKMGYQITPIFFNYGQLTLKRELFCVRKLTEFLKLQSLIIIKLPWLHLTSGKSGLINKEIKLINKKTWIREYVPFRNTIFLSIATAFAEVKNLDAIFIGSTRTDRICPDNRVSYLRAFQKTLKLGTKLKTDIKIIAPFINKSKSEVIKIGYRLGVPLEFTWSCHKTNNKACGLCSNCASRLEAFSKNNLKDPIKYADHSYFKRD